MSTKAPARPTTDKDPALDMSSMIDVSFLLLIFFLLTSTLDPKEADLGMALPGKPARIIDFDPIMEPMEIQVKSNGKVLLDGTTLDTDIHSRDLPLLGDKLKQYKTASDLLSTEPLIAVIADDDVPGQRFVDVLNTLAKVEIKNVTIADVAKQ